MRRFRSITATIGTVLAAAALVVAGTGLGPVPSAQAAIYNPIPFDTEGFPNDQFLDNDVLQAYVTSDTMGGTVCVVPAAIDYTDKSSCKKEHVPWSTPNFILGVGSTIQPIEANLVPGSYRLMTENTTPEPTGLSDVFTVSPCPGCSREFADEYIQEWKDAAKINLIGLGIPCVAMKVKSTIEKIKQPSKSYTVSGIDLVTVSFDFSTGAFGIAVVNPLKIGEKKAIEILQQVTCAASKMYLNIVQDPPDPGYDTVAAPEVLPADDVDPAEGDAAIAALAQQTGLGQASLTAFERYLGARDDGDQAGVARQAQAVSDYTFDLIDDITASADALDAYADHAAAVPELGGAVIDTQDHLDALTAAYERIRDTGFDSDELADLHDDGFDDAEIASLREHFGADSEQLTPGQTLAEYTHQLADTLRSSIEGFQHFGTEAAIVAARNLSDIPGGSAPTAVISSSAVTGAAPITISFDGSQSGDSDGSIAGYEWDFGDGGSSTETSTTHTFEAEGTYTVTLTVTDDLGLTNTASTTIEVLPPGTNLPPVIEIGPGPFTADEGTSPPIGASATDPDGTIVSGEWVASNGLTSDAISNPPPLPDDGIYGLTLTVTDDAGATATATVQVEVLNVAPTAYQAGTVPVRAAPGVARSFEVGLLDPGVDDAPTAVWDFGDGGTASGTVVDHTWDAPGSYPVTVTATDKDGGSSTLDYSTIAVLTPVLDAGPPVSGIEGSEVSFDFSGSTPPDDALGYQIDFGDGEVFGVGEELTARHTYAQGGTYTVTLTASDSLVEGDSPRVTSDSTIAEIATVPPTVLGIANSAPVVGDPASFQVFFTDAGSTEGSTFAWDFGDGASGAGKVATHAYATAGPNVVTVTVTDATGESTSFTRAIAVASSPDGANPSSAGRDFWIAFDANYDLTEQNRALTVFVSGAPGVTGVVEVPGIGFATTYTVPAAGVAAVDVPIEALVGMVGTLAPARTESRAVHVSADAEVTVYGLNRAQYTTDAYLALPVTAAGTRFRVMDYAFFTGGLFSVVATSGSTAVHVEPSAESGLEPFDTTLQMGEVFEYEAAGNPSLTGSLITTDRPVSVYGGNRCANIPAGYTACDHIIEQLSPTAAWGKTFVTYPLASRSADTFRILADADDTSVTVTRASGSETYTLAAGEYREFQSGEAMTIQAGKPVSVAQYSNSSSYDGVTSDPFMVMVPPFEQGFTDSSFATPTTGFTNYVNITAATADIGGVSLDGSGVDANLWTAIPGSSYSGAAIPIEAGVHTITSTAPVGTVVYGFAEFDSYGFPGGMRLADVAAATSLSLDPATASTVPGSELCTIATLEDGGGAGIAGARIDVTVTGALNQAFSVVTDGSGAAPICLTASIAGSATVTAAFAGLTDTATLSWTATSEPENRLPLAALTAPAAAPEGTTATLDASGSSDPDGDLLAYAWDLDGDGAFDDATGPAASAPLPLVGSLTVAMRVTDPDGLTATAETVITITNVLPVVSLPATAAVAPSGAYSATGSFTDPGADTWSAQVDYGDGAGPVPLALADFGFSLEHTYPTAGLYTVTVTVRDAAGGSTGTASSILTVAAVVPVDPEPPIDPPVEPPVTPPLTPPAEPAPPGTAPAPPIGSPAATPVPGASDGSIATTGSQLALLGAGALLLLFAGGMLLLVRRTRRRT